MLTAVKLKSQSLSHGSGGGPGERLPSPKSSSPYIFFPSLWDDSRTFPRLSESILNSRTPARKTGILIFSILFPNPNRHTYHASWLAVTGKARAAQKWLAQQEAARRQLRPAPHSCLCRCWCRPLAFLGVGVCHFSNKSSKCASRKPPEICSSHLCLRFISTDCEKKIRIFTEISALKLLQTTVLSHSTSYDCNITTLEML